ncbi:transposable element Tc3 transposase [Trichonephila clavipes]|nr:transposable element Tc3 transposase [Trichonephila clavipes]
MRGTLTGQRYVDDILRPHVGAFLNGLPGAIFQQDNARPHTARVAQDFLRHSLTLPWPARSPDLSPVEHVRDQLKLQMPSDEAHFWLNDYVNKQNCRIWCEANPQVYVETPLHPEKLIVWCTLWAGGILGQYFFKNDEGHNVTVNGDRYRAMITNFFIPKLNNHDVLELWFQQDGATCHTARATIDLLKDMFGDRLI